MGAGPLRSEKLFYPPPPLPLEQVSLLVMSKVYTQPWKSPFKSCFLFFFSALATLFGTASHVAPFFTPPPRRGFPMTFPPTVPFPAVPSDPRATNTELS